MAPHHPLGEQVVTEANGCTDVRHRLLQTEGEVRLSGVQRAFLSPSSSPLPPGGAPFSATVSRRRFSNGREPMNPMGVAQIADSDSAGPRQVLRFEISNRLPVMSTLLAHRPV